MMGSEDDEYLENTECITVVHKTSREGVVFHGMRDG
jgi:hypothetical protein